MKVNGESASAAEEFLETSDNLIVDKNYFPEQIFNLDETSLFWKQMPERTFFHKEAKSMPGFKAFVVCVCVRKISPELTSMLILLFLLRKTGSELTSIASPPPFFPQSTSRQLYVIVAHPSSCCMWDADSAWAEKRCCGARPGSEPGPPVAERAHLTAKPGGWPCIPFLE